MRHRILVVAQDVMLRSTLVRWLMPAGYSVELAESGRRAREVLAAHPVALTILVRDRSGAPALKPGPQRHKAASESLGVRMDPSARRRRHQL